MDTLDLRGRASLDPGAMIGRFYVGDCILNIKAVGLMV